MNYKYSPLYKKDWNGILIMTAERRKSRLRADISQKE
jgi:hypothetical protein